MDGATESRNGKILLSIIENTPYTDQPQSRIEELLIELKEIIEAGGGGGTTSYDGLTGKPKINGYTLSGDVSLSDIGAASETDLAEKQDEINDLAAIRSGAASGATAVQPAALQNAVQGLQTDISDETAAREAADSEMQDAISEDRAALIAQVDSGAKNLINAPNGSGMRLVDIPIVLQPGTYYVQFQNITSTDTGASVCQFGAFAEDNSQASNFPQLKRGDNSGSIFTVTKQTSYVRLYASSSYAGGEGDKVTFTGCMICTASDYAISPAFVPYRPSWQEMWDIIQALQSGGASTQSASTASLMSVKPTIEPDVMPEEGEKQDE